MFCNLLGVVKDIVLIGLIGHLRNGFSLGGVAGTFCAFGAFGSRERFVKGTNASKSTTVEQAIVNETMNSGRWQSKVTA